jgi:glycerol-3-phosphate dehydrogenase
MEFDLIIIGAGINGAGVARDAAMRGLRVLLLDKGDISSGTSSWSTRLIHGGLRYLEHGELGLVRESLRERQTLLTIAPHLVRPLPILLPIYSGGQRGQWTIRAGMLAYDLLSFDRKLPGHRALLKDEVIEAAPGLNPEGLQGGVVYYDAQVEFAERLVLENALSAIEHGASVMTYSEVCAFTLESGVVRGVRFKHQFTGESHEARCQLVVNAAGPWVDRVLAQAGFPSSPLIGGTKGSHIIVARFPGAPEHAVYVEAEKDRRPIFIIPWSGKYLIGTTDIRYNGCLDRVEINNTEIEYLLSETNRLIPSAHLSCDSILFAYSGVRPLPFVCEKKEEGITRRHFIHEHTEPRGLLSLIGGKLTTYRSLAEETVDLCLRRLGVKAKSCATAQTPLPGAAGDPAAAERLSRVYGSRATEVMRMAQADSRLLEVFDEETGAIAAEIVFAFRHELAQTLCDCLLRRTLVGLNSSCGLKAVVAASEVCREHLGWSETRARKEIEAYKCYVKRFHPRE